MPRKKRVWFPGATYHVMSRGNRRNAIFKNSSDYLEFLEYLKLVKDLYPFEVHSLCLMTNHFHMAIETADIPISKIMHRLLLSYSANYNRKYLLTGHLFENRYTAKLIEDERYLLEVSRYIHLNPVKARMVKEPLEYEYSSYGFYVSDSEKAVRYKPENMISELINTDRILGCFHNNHREQYRMFVEGKISHEEAELLIQKDMKEDDMWLPWKAETG
ncbi:MAG: transposase [Lachnospiraceae bacterium]|nr:transposase [Lachnospiraceae bacterium]